MVCGCAALIFYFVYRWLPAQCGKAKVIMPDGSEKGDKSNNRLDLQTWMMAWDRYVLGAVALDQVCCGHRPGCAYVLLISFACR